MQWKVTKAFEQGNDKICLMFIITPAAVCEMYWRMQRVEIKIPTQGIALVRQNVMMTWTNMSPKTERRSKI